ncbi:NAD-dependent histone deacetylase SIR2 [Rhizoctonia solani AG-3 Rhs1AP]|uniref:NAD-dependent histone deacetylase SIR2 n=1 Tax=Rhizoctonia solani AG-3 Rhs1AP TaxID=1086054 RepID=A0A0A1UL69_9AGAM|nr:NAD-dependent histone deacetylase SIR2 [Rhizoctonia solani AG-3 Rhs1AP]
MNGALNPKAVTEVQPPQELDDMYQDVDSEEFSELGSDLDEQEAGEGEVPALERLNEQMQATFSDQDIDEMIVYLKEAGMMAWIKKYVTERDIPVLLLLAALGAPIPLNAQNEPHSDPNMLHRLLKVTLTRILRRRSKLGHINTPDDVVNLIKRSKNIVVLTGAGISVSCGIPDFRSSSGIYAQINESNNYELEDPQQMFDIDYFRERPSVFYSFASQIYPSNFIPSPCHRFIRLLEDRDILLRNYTQNIDTLETEVGVTRVLQCHGSFATATCIECKTKVNGSLLKDDIFAQQIPLCKACNKSTPPAKGKPRSRSKSKSKKKDVWNPKQKDEDDDMDIPTPPLPKSIMKPDIVFFGEPLNDEFDHCLFKDRESVDLLLVIGTSLKVAPVSEILTHIPHSVPQVLINKTPVTHVNPDVVLLGDADRVIEYLCDRLAWSLPGVGPPNKAKAQVRLPGVPIKPVKAYNHDHVWLFPGGEGGSWALRDSPPSLKPPPSVIPSRPDSATSSIRKRLSNESLRPTLDRKDTDRNAKKSRLV